MTTEAVEPTTEQAEWITKRDKIEVRSIRLLVMTLVASIAAVASAIISSEMKALWEMTGEDSYGIWLVVTQTLLSVTLVLLITEYLVTRKEHKRLGKYPTSEGGLGEPKTVLKIKITQAAILLATVGVIGWVVIVTTNLL